MRLLFVYETRFKQDDQGKLYTDGGLNNSVWSRYFSVADTVSVVSKLDDEVFPESYAKEKFNPFDNPNMSFIRIPDYYRSLLTYLNPLTWKQIRDTLTKEISQSDYVIVRMPSSVARIACRIARRYRKPYLIEAVGCPWDSFWNFGTLKGRIYAPISVLSMRESIRKAPFVLYVSRRFLQNRYPTKGKQVACPDVVLAEPEDEVLLKRLRKIADLHSRDKVVLGLIGSLNVSYRGHETAIKVLEKLDDQRFCFRFLGPGNKEKWIELARDRSVDQQLEFSGVLPTGQPVMNWIDDIDILVMPTKQETLGRAIIEAMSRGCPVIGSIETAISEQIGSDCVCSASDDQAIAEIIQRMVTDPDYMSYCAKENFYRSFKYTNKQTEKIRAKFFADFRESGMVKN